MRTTPPPELDHALRLMSLQSMIHRPKFTGWENIPDHRPLLFVGNHTLMGVLDVPFLFRALVWGQRQGFARMAVQHEATIVPFAAVGVEDALDIVYDANDMANSRVGRVLDFVGIRDDLRLPVVRGIGPTPIPRPERYDFHFMEPVQVRAANVDDPDSIWEVRERTRKRIESGIALLRERRANPTS